MISGVLSKGVEGPKAAILEGEKSAAFTLVQLSRICLKPSIFTL